MVQRLATALGLLGTLMVLAAALSAVALPATALRFDGAEPPAPPKHRFQVPPGWVVQKVAGPPLVDYPLFACFDDRGRLYVAEGTGKNLPGSELVKLNLGKITRLDDSDGDGVFDSRTTFADHLVFPQGVLWLDGAVYTASHPAIWRLEDSDGDGRSDRRAELVGRFGFNGNGCDIHGPFLGPDGWLYWTDGRHGHECPTREGTKLTGFAARIFRCRPDGTRLERIAGGGFDNPVELSWTVGGELIGTMDQGPGDCLLHYIEGGVYPRDDQPCLAEFPKTGPLLSPVTMFSAALPVALCGMCRITTDHFGGEYRDVLLTAQFNVHRIQQHALMRDGATYRATNKDFVLSTDYDSHPSDVLEDADGSLLVVDMGAWFNYGCPTSKIAKPEVKGSIYRVRNTAAPRMADPWGNAIAWERLSPAELDGRLDDPRPMVRERAIRELARRAQQPESARQVADGLSRAAGFGGEPPARPRSAEARRNAVWALCRAGTEPALEVIRTALRDDDQTVRLAALHAIALWRDRCARSPLETIVVQDLPSLRLKAAEALGRLGDPAAVPALLASLRRGQCDRFLEHALIYALIRIQHRAATLPALADSNPAVRRAGLIALDQMPDGQLTREQVVPLLDTDDVELQQAAMDVIGRHAGWAADLVGTLREYVGRTTLSDPEQAALTGAILALGGTPEVQEFVADRLKSPATPVVNRRLLLGAMARAKGTTLPPSSLDALQQTLRSDDRSLQRDAVAVVRVRNLTQFDARLAELAAGSDVPLDLRIAALECTAPRLNRLDGAAFELLTRQLSDDADPLLRVAAARTIGACRLDKPQLLELADRLAQAGPLTVPLLTPAFATSGDVPVGESLVAALRKSPGADSLSPDELRKLVGRYGGAVEAAAAPLLAKLAAREHEQEAYLAELLARSLGTPGNPERGRQLFFSKKVGCSGCHRIEGQGGNVGPDLSQIGRIRDPRALLEAVVFPSSTIVPEYRSYTLATRSGTVVQGMIVRETADAISLRTAQLAEIRLARSDVEDLRPSTTSIMPQGMEKTMSAEELTDLLEFLYQRR
jgi:putative membrane-bound dehydrogenase-like protein